MTATTTAPVDERTLASARAFVADVGRPSKREMQKHLGKQWATVNAVMAQLDDEARSEGDRRRRESRRAMRRLSSRKRLGSARLAMPGRQRTVNEISPLSPGMGPVGPPTMPTPAAPRPASAAVRLDTPAPPVPSQARRVKAWPLLLLALPAFVAIWSGWVGLGGLTGFGVVHPLPGIADQVSLNTAITLPIGLETYAAYALYVWLSGAVVSVRARKFAMVSALLSLTLGAGGQITYHLLVSDGPWIITTIVACLPVAVLGMGAALYHLVHVDEKES